MSDDWLAERAALISRKGWARAGYDQRIWVPCPEVLPEGWDQQRWAGEFAAGWWGMSGLPFRPSDVTRLATLLGQVYEDTWGPAARILCSVVFIHLPDPRLLPLPVYLAILRTIGDREAVLRRLSMVDDPSVIRDPEAVEFTTEHLGQGLRVLRYWNGDDEGEVDVGLSYAFRSEEFETDLRLFTATNDLDRLQQAIPDMDTLARQLTVISREDAT